MNRSPRDASRNQGSSLREEDSMQKNSRAQSTPLNTFQMHVANDIHMDAIKEKAEISNYNDSLDRYTGFSKHENLEFDKSLIAQHKRTSTQAEKRRRFQYINQWDSRDEKLKKRLNQIDQRLEQMEIKKIKHTSMWTDVLNGSSIVVDDQQMPAKATQRTMRSRSPPEVQNSRFSKEAGTLVMDSVNLTIKDSIFGNTARTNTASVNQDVEVSRNYQRLQLRSEATQRKIKNQLDNFLAYDSINEGQPSCNYSDFAKMLVSGNLNIPKVRKKPPQKLKELLKPLSPASVKLGLPLVNIKDEAK